MKKPQRSGVKVKKKKFHPLRLQISVWFIGLLLLSMVITTVINGLFLEHYYISKKTEVLQEAVENLEDLKVETTSDGSCSAEVSDAMFKDSSENNLTWIVITADGQTVCAVGSNEDLLEARLVGYVYDLDKKNDHAKVIQQNDNYVIQQVSDRFAGMEYVESWGEMDNGCYFLIRTPLESIRESVSISNKFYFYVGIMIIVISGLVIWFVTKRITRPISELTLLSTKMSDLDFEAKYQSHSGNEIDELGENFNRMSEQLEKTISELKSANNQLQKDIENKERIDQMRQEFLNNVSHELKTPITSMKILADSLLMQPDVPVELYEEFMNDIVHEIDRENQIITDLLTLVKMDKTQADLNITSVKINDLLEVLLKRISPIAEKRGIKIRLETMREVVAEVDEVKLSLACNNLIENAVKYNHDDGKVDVSLNADHKFFYIRVKDTGCGIPEDCQEQIFERFYRVDKARSRETGGTGLGLAITRNVVLMHKGSIRVHSKEGEGATFIIRIPLNYIS